MGNLFSLFTKSSKDDGHKDQETVTITDYDKIRMRIKIKTDKFKKEISKADKRIEQLTTMIHQHRGDKTMALMFFKIRKLQINKRTTLFDQITKLEQQKNDLEKADMLAAVMKTLEQGNEVMKEMQSMMDLGKVESILIENREHAENIDTFVHELGAETGTMLHNDLGDLEMEQFEAEMMETLNISSNDEQLVSSTSTKKEDEQQQKKETVVNEDSNIEESKNEEKVEETKIPESNVEETTKEEKVEDTKIPESLDLPEVPVLVTKKQTQEVEEPIAA